MRIQLSKFATFALLFTLWMGLSAFYNGEEYGKAAYYADKLHGRKTASGEPYNKEDFTCAHKTYPFGTKLKVTNLDNGYSVIVRVTDRGPFHEGYVVDISRAAAESIGLIKAGVARVKVEQAAEEKTGPTKEKILPAEAPTTGAVPAAPQPAQYSTPGTTTAKGVSSAPATVRNTQLIKSHEQAAAAASAPATASAAVRPAQYSTSSPAPDPRPQTVTTTPANTTAKGAAAPVTTTPEPPQTTLFKVSITEAQKKGFGIQVSTLLDADNVLPIVKKIESQWPGKSLVLSSYNASADVTTYKVIIGAFGDKASADAQYKLAKKKGYKDSFIVDLSTL